MKIRDIAAKFADELATHYDAEEAKAIFLLVIEHYFKINRSNYLLRNDEVLSIADIKQFETTIYHLKMGKPIQYILGETSFYGLPLKVNEAVLIPRPETEELVEWVIEKVNSFQFSVDSFGRSTHAPRSKLNLLDIGTGSGCIAISLKKNLPQLNVTALDVSSEALVVAKQNAELNGVEIDFIEESILESSVSLLTTHYSLLISNPPYITEDEKVYMHENVLAHEPHLALFVSNEKPLLFYEAIADFALKNLTEQGLLFFEINEYLGEETVEMLANKGFNNMN